MLSSVTLDFFLQTLKIEFNLQHVLEKCNHTNCHARTLLSGSQHSRKWIHAKLVPTRRDGFGGQARWNDSKERRLMFARSNTVCDGV
jgi:hypothetical protein